MLELTKFLPFYDTKNIFYLVWNSEIFRLIFAVFKTVSIFYITFLFYKLLKKKLNTITSIISIVLVLLIGFMLHIHIYDTLPITIIKNTFPSENFSGLARYPTKIVPSSKEYKVKLDSASYLLLKENILEKYCSNENIEKCKNTIDRAITIINKDIIRIVE